MVPIAWCVSLYDVSVPCIHGRSGRGSAWVETLGDQSNVVLDGVTISHGFNVAFAKLLWPHVCFIYLS